MTSFALSSFSTPSPFEEYKWFNSHSVQQEFHCGVCRLELPVSIDITSSNAPQDLWINAQINCYGIPVQDGVLSTSFALSDLRRNAFVWNTLLNFRVKIKDLSPDASIVFTAWDPSDGVGGKIYGMTTLGLFDENGKMKTGHQKLIFYASGGEQCLPTDVPMMSAKCDPTQSAGYLRKHAKGERYDLLRHHDQAFLMEKHLEEFERFVISSKQRDFVAVAIYAADSHDPSRSSGKWLDALSKSRIEAILEESSNREVLGTGFPAMGKNLTATKLNSRRSKTRSTLMLSPEERSMRQQFCMVVALPFPPYPILFKERRYTGVPQHFPPTTLAQMMPPGCNVVVEKDVGIKRTGVNSLEYQNSIKDSSTLPATILEFSLLGGPVGGGASLGGPAAFTGASLCVIADWDIDQENLAEQQYRCLAHDILRGKLDTSVKPSLEDKGKIEKILNAAGTHMVFEEMDLLYRYRYFLTENKKALLKFLLSVDWTVESEVAEVPVLLAQWKRKAPLDISDALRLLGKEKAFQALIVRHYAVETLQTATDEELLTFLLQLVQALRYEPSMDVVADTCEANSTLRMQDESSYHIASSFSSSFAWARVGMSASGLGPSITDRKSPTPSSSSIIGHHGAGLVSPLAQFLIDRACASPIVANFFYWYLKVETEDESVSGNLFRQIFDSFLIQLASSTSCASSSAEHLEGSTFPRVVDVFQGAECALQLYALNEYISKIFECHSTARALSGRKDVKQAALRKLLKEKGLDRIPCRIEGTTLTSPFFLS